MKLCATLVLCLFCAFTLAESEDAGGLNAIYKTVEKCSADRDVGVCLKLKAVALMDRALRQPDAIALTDFVSVVKDPSAASAASDNESESDIAARLPRSYDDKSRSLDEMLWDRLYRFLQTRTLQFSIPADVLEGRKKKDKGGHMMIGALAMGGMMIQMVMAKIALIAGKALLVGKIALLLSAIIGLKKLVGGGGGGDSHPQVIYAHGGGGDHGGWGRSIPLPLAHEENKAHEMAYSAQVPQ
ncbi:uncharacterized protein LOC111053708 [Nilaparvata lugens]|uniref:uncharacterized protein LOC111053708 n=1 Tax=Nilaparvata lugens TaxID=108931 RepID=UPI00193DC0D7|nr:uncharacterized protein LOC111053708 [Nilaparvata lugens]